MGLRITEEELFVLQQKRRADKLKRPKYGNKKVEIDGYTFDSKKEGQRYTELKLRQRAGEITDLELQPEFPFEINGKKIFSYFSDFKYHDVKLNCTIIEDVKGVKTPVYRLKKKLIEAYHEIKITEV